MRKISVSESFRFRTFAASFVLGSLSGILQPALAAPCSFPLTLAAGGSCDAVIVPYGQSGTVDNSGDIGNGSTGFAILIDTTSEITSLINNAGGTITASVAAINNGGSIGNIINNGSISGSYAFYNYGSMGTFTNNGALTGNYGAILHMFPQSSGSFE